MRKLIVNSGYNVLSNIFVTFMSSAVVMLMLSLNSALSAEVNSAKPVLVHYMPWYASKPVSGEWGWHWTMGRFDPEKIRSNGQREVASHDYPLIGLYDSNDPDALECHVLQMKMAGINGVIVDWYGISDFRDYGHIHRNTRHLVKFIKQAGLKFAICYEDQTIKHMLENKFISQQDAVARGKDAFKWLDEHWLADDAYVKIQGQPILLVFGPQYYHKANWLQLKAGLSLPPLLFGLPHLTKSAGFDGMFLWPPVSGGKTVTPDEWQKQLRLHYDKSSAEPVLAVAFPGFHDIYEQAGLHKSYGLIEARGGKTLEESLKLAAESDSPLIQIATWNDYGEGTIVEPDTKRGYQSLEMIQNFIKSQDSNVTTATANDLRLPARLYQLKKQYQKQPDELQKLKKAAAFLFASQYDAAREILESYPLKTR
ncbi:glycoside hydrolase family 71/99-like protein [Gimesia aquarii]|uniref:Glycosyl hydrolase family 71 n=1 Tax=Gimesia aquarii TaxID=2527964 RepID=A0A517VZ13_9PLAN|nr:glycoside hydrolase family 71/99-like protein [Gimesia aquarii]QDT98255.1 hypothetical protein V144x_37410 [Gimesia aquarii]